jgi:excisionase family DNA binding protein
LYAAIRRYRVDPSDRGEVIRQIAESFAPIIREVQGFVAYYVLDAEDGVFATVSIFEDQTGVEESNNMAAELARELLAKAILSQEEAPNIFLRVEETLQGTLYGGASDSLQSLHKSSLDGQIVIEPPLKEEVSESEDSSESQGLDLLSLVEVCQELGMGKSWVYSRIRSGEIPSVKLGNNIKVKRQDLEEYLENQRYQPPSEE